jgi:hypothetical protein
MTIYESLCGVYARMYKEDKIIPWGTVARLAMISVYNKFVNDKSIIPIEELPEEEKKYLVAECNRSHPGHSNATLIEQCRMFHLTRILCMPHNTE